MSLKVGDSFSRNIVNAWDKYLLYYQFLSIRDIRLDLNVNIFTTSSYFVGCFVLEFENRGKRGGEKFRGIKLMGTVDDETYAVLVTIIG